MDDVGEAVTAATSTRDRMWMWWFGGFGWCRFLGHRYDPDEGCCSRCGGIPDEMLDEEGLT